MVAAGYNNTIEYLDDPDAMASGYPARPALPSEVMSTAESLAKSSMERKIQTGHIVNHHGATQMYIANMALAKKLGFSEDEKSPIVPFPSPSKNVYIQDNGSAALAELTSKLIDTLAKLQTPQSEKLDTSQPESNPVSDSVVMRVVSKTNTTPSKIQTAVSFWQRLKNNSGLASLVLWLGSLVGGAAYYYWPTEEPAIASPVKPSDVQGNLKVTIE